MPGLLLTPPYRPGENDGSCVTASGIAVLRLDTDWIILATCNNTVASGEPGAEALADLARAFTYAQAHALLVSRWAVNSGAILKLIVGAMFMIATDKSRGGARNKALPLWSGRSGRILIGVDWGRFGSSQETFQTLGMAAPRSIRCR